MVNVTIGTVSEGTLRTEELLDAFASELERIDQDDWHTIESRWLLQNEQVDEKPDYASELVNAMQDALDACAPPHTYFGTLEGDGACFGFWPVQDPFNETCKVSETNGDGEFVDEDCGVIVQISDHGNILVMDMDRNEIWSAV